MEADDASLYELTGGIKLSGSADGILVPVYSCHPGNRYYVSSTHSDMTISRFEELDGFLERIIHLGVEHRPRAFSVDELAPVLIFVENNTEVVTGASWKELIRGLRSSALADTEAARDAINDIGEANESETDRAYDRDRQLISKLPDDIPTKAARLWLDMTLQPVRIATTEEAKSISRMELLAWARENAIYATSPIFDHFVTVTNSAEQSGVFVKDILAIALLQRATDSVARIDRVKRTIWEFIGRYGHGPLLTVIELSRHGIPELAQIGRDVLNRYYAWLREKAVGQTDYADVVFLTLVSSPDEQWPKDIELIIRRALRDTLVSVAQLVKRREELLKELDAQSSAFGADSGAAVLVKRELLQNAGLLKDAARTASTLYKSVNVKDESSFQIGLSSEIDYTALGLNREYFSALERPLEHSAFDWAK